MCAGGGGGPKRPSWDQKWPNMATLPMSQSGLKGSKIIPYDQYNMILTIWHHFGPIWTLLDHFRQNLIFCSKVVLAKKHFLFCRQRIKFFLKWSKRTKMGPYLSQMASENHLSISIQWSWNHLKIFWSPSCCWEKTTRWWKVTWRLRFLSTTNHYYYYKRLFVDGVKSTKTHIFVR